MNKKILLFSIILLFIAFIIFVTGCNNIDNSKTGAYGKVTFGMGDCMPKICSGTIDCFLSSNFEKKHSSVDADILFVKYDTAKEHVFFRNLTEQDYIKVSAKGNYIVYLSEGEYVVIIDKIRYKSKATGEIVEESFLEKGVSEILEVPSGKPIKRDLEFFYCTSH